MAQGIRNKKNANELGDKNNQEELVSPGEAKELQQLFNLPSARLSDNNSNSTESTNSEDSDKKLTRNDIEQAEASGGDQSENASTETGPTGSPQEQAYEDRVGKGYTGDKGSASNRARNYRRIAAVGGLTGAIITIMVLLFNFLNVFKLDGLMSNIEQKSFLRHNASLNTRSSKWISAYVEARMMQFGDNPTKNPLFRSNRVDTNSPFTDWYRTLRASNFEQDVFEKHGIKFTSYFDANGSPRLGKIDISVAGTTDSMNLKIPDGDLEAIAKGDLKVLSNYQDYFNMEKLDSHKAGRQAIKKVVNDNTHWSQVYKRRFLRRSIQNMTGVRSWRFFENTRDKITAKKLDIRNRIITYMVPDSNVLGRVTRCLFGIDNCTPSRDTADPKEQVNVTSDEFGAQQPTDTSTQAQKDAEKALATESTKLDEAALSETLRNVLKNAGIINQIINIPNTLDMFASIDKGVQHLVKYVVIARGAQAAGLFQVFQTSRDQIKTGQVSSEEVNAFMQGIDTAGSSAAYSQVISGNSTTQPGTTQSGGQCTQAAQALQEKDPQAYLKQFKTDYAPLCADQQIGSASNAQKIQDAYDNGPKQVVHPIVALWESAKSNGFFGAIINAVEWFTNHIFNALASTLNAILDILGLKGDFQGLVTWVFTKVSSFLGVSILKGYESAGTLFNWLVQGGAYSAESSSRQEGAAVTNTASQASAQNTIAQYITDKRTQTSLYDKLASLNNPDSLAFKGATMLSNTKSDPSTALMAGIHSLWTGAIKNMGAIFSGRLLAASSNGYAASQFAGIETYDYPQKCYDLDPITEQPIDGTNAPDILRQNNISVPESLYNWDTERSSSMFYAAIYAAIGENTTDGDNIAVQIYNCNLLDTAVRGSLGYLYGYNADATSQVIDSTNSTSGGSGGTTPGGCGGSGKYSAIVDNGASFAGIDQGIDFTPQTSAGFNICAPGPGTITLADQTGHKFEKTDGTAEIIERLDAPPGPIPSISRQFIYYAEIIQLDGAIKVGAHVAKGDLIGHNNKSPGIEVGWAPSATAGFGCSVGGQTACGTDFNDWVQVQ